MMKLNAVAVLLFRKALPAKTFLEYFDYKHSYFKNAKETFPVGFLVNLNDIEKDGVTKFTTHEIKDKGIILKIKAEPSPTIDYVSIIKTLNTVPKEEIDKKQTEVYITQFKNIKSIKEFREYIEKCQKHIDGLEVKYIGHCNQPNECIVGRIKDICKKCDVFDNEQIDAIGKEPLKV